MAVVFPTATKAQGNNSVVVLQTVATPASPSLGTEINATSSVDVSFYLYGDFQPTAEANKGSAPARLGDTTERESFGRVKHTYGDLQYVYDPQGADTTSDNKAKAALPEGAEVWLMQRIGLNADTAAMATGQKVIMHHVVVGPQSRTQTGSDEFAEFSITQPVMSLEPPVEGTIAT